MGHKEGDNSTQSKLTGSYKVCRNSGRKAWNGSSKIIPRQRH